MRIMLHFLLLFLVLAMSSNAYVKVDSMSGEVAGDQYGSAMCLVDFNADGKKDLVVSAPAADDAGISSGKVYIYFGGSAADTIADLVLVGSSGSFFGQTLSSAGDFNADGYEDLLIGAPFYDLPVDNAGAAGLYYGGPSPDTVVDHIFVGVAVEDYFGQGVASVGDFNNDTYDDIAIGAYRADWGIYENSGKVYVYYGGPNPDFAADRILVGQADGERFGFSLTGGDFNSDDVSDIAVGAYSYDGTLVNQGRVYIFNGSVSPDTVIDFTLTGETSGENFGWSLTTGKINDDALFDLVVGCEGYTEGTFNVGRIQVYYGSAVFDATADFSYNLGREKDDQIGYAVVSGVDLDNDGFHETLVGMPGNNDGGETAGGAAMLRGGSIPAQAGQFLGEYDNEELGGAVAIWPDYGESWVIVAGASGYNEYQGRVVLYTTGSGCCEIRGDINSSGAGPDISDLVYLVTYMFSSGPPPSCMEEADTNGSGSGPDISDLVYLVSYMFQDGDPIPACDI